MISPLRDHRAFSTRRVLGALGGAALLPRAPVTRLVSAGAQGARVLAVAGSLQADAVVAALAEFDGFVLRGKREIRRGRGGGCKGRARPGITAVF